MKFNLLQNLGVVTEEVNADSSSDESDDADFCTIPIKPDWREIENPEEFHRLETMTFLKWKKQLNKLQNKYPNLPPFEKNLDFWRQLWKIVELSHVVVQVKISEEMKAYVTFTISANKVRSRNCNLVESAHFPITHSDYFFSIQVVDARDPLFYYSHDLSEYVKSISRSCKNNVLLLNKADFLSADQRRMWAKYFKVCALLYFVL